jgi:SAM-dependent methyltransferase
MERTEWLKHMRDMAEALYDHFGYLSLSSSASIELGQYYDMHLEYIQKFLERIPPRSILLSAACGDGRFDGLLLKAGHRVVGTDQSAGMLARAKGHFPEVRYEKIGMQEMDFREEFDGAICMDALEHICPEDWPVIMRNFQRALKPGGVLYFTFWPMELAGMDIVEKAYKRGKEQGMPVVFGEKADEVEGAYKKAIESGKPTDESVYHYCPSLKQVREWIGQAGMAIEEEGIGDDYEHFVVRKR